jgi:hypothetical protein
MATTLLTTVSAPGSASAPPSAHASHRLVPTQVTIGSIAGTPSLLCSNTTLANTQNGPGQPSYVVPADGVITSWSVKATSAPTQVRMLLFGSPSGNTYPLVGKSTTRALIPSAVNTFDVRVPVKAGWRLGARFIGSNIPCVAPGTASDTVGSDLSGADPDVVSSVPLTPVAAGLVDIAAVVEPDADLDGFGDVSQDACPVSALAQAACPDPQTTITKAPKARSGKPKVRLEFTSSVPGSTFLVTVDGRQAVPSLSPFVSKMGRGRHTITVQAVSPLGPVDHTPESVTFKIRTKKKPR